jgi:hypothetical protein
MLILEPDQIVEVPEAHLKIFWETALQHNQLPAQEK